MLNSLACRGGWAAALLTVAGLLVSNAAQAQAAPAVAGVSRRQLHALQALPNPTVSGVLMNEVTLGPGQSSPDHHHPGEVYTYVLEGEIKCQVAGQKPQILRAGDSFREAAGQRILAFNNNSTTRPCRFVAFYLLRNQQPPIVLTAPAPQGTGK